MYAAQRALSFAGFMIKTYTYIFLDVKIKKSIPEKYQNVVKHAGTSLILFLKSIIKCHRKLATNLLHFPFHNLPNRGLSLSKFNSTCI